MKLKKIALGFVTLLLCLEVTIVLHELGHYAAAKACGVYCPEFRVGIGSSVTLAKTGETEWNFGLFPVMGGVSMVVRDPGEEVPTIDGVPIDGLALDQLSAPQLIAVMGAGVLINFILGFGSFILLLRLAKPEHRPDVWKTVKLMGSLLVYSGYYLFLSIVTFGRYPAQKVQVKMTGDTAKALAEAAASGKPIKQADIKVEEVKETESEKAEKEKAPFWIRTLIVFGSINLTLGLLNLLPIPGLDGFWLFCTVFGIDVRTALSWVPENFTTWFIWISVIHSVIYFLVPRKKVQVLVIEQAS
jgi:membrane-associated protease RseP (regulator of RpoE activity)